MTNAHINSVISRAEARAAGLTEYFTGEPCVRGHLGPRSVKAKKCRACEALRKRKARKENPEKFRAIQAKCHADNREENLRKMRERRARNVDVARAKDRARYLRDKDKRLAENKAWREENRDRCIARCRRYYAENRDKFRAALHRRRARERNAEGSHTPDDIKRIFKQQKGRCAYCRDKLNSDFHLDHIKPIAKGGSNSPNNLQALCAPCNRSKSAKDPIDFAKQIGMLI